METSPGEYAFSPGEEFKFTVNNVNNAISGLHQPLSDSLKKVGVLEYDRLIYSTVMAHSLQHQQEGLDPRQFMTELTSTDDETAVEALNELKEGDVAGYLKVFENSGQMSKTEVRRLQKDIQAILDGYNAYSQ